MFFEEKKCRVSGLYMYKFTTINESHIVALQYIYIFSRKRFIPMRMRMKFLKFVYYMFEKHFLLNRKEFYFIFQICWSTPNTYENAALPSPWRRSRIRPGFVAKKRIRPESYPLVTWIWIWCDMVHTATGMVPT